MLNSDNLVLKDWFTEVIKEYRERYESSSKTLRKFLSKIDDFGCPCQILSLTVASPPLTFVYVTHDTSRSDLEVYSYGPTMPHELLPKMEKVLSDEQLYRELRPEEREFSNEESFGKYLENQFIWIQEVVRAQSLRPPIQTENMQIGIKMSIMFKGFMWMVYNQLESASPEEFVDTIFKGERERGEEDKKNIDNKKVTSQKPEEEKIQGFSTYFYPNVWVGDVPEFTFRRRVEGYSIYPNPIFPYDYKGLILVVDQRGWLFVEGKEPGKCIEVMNEIMGVSLLLNFDFDAVRLEDIGEASISKETKEMRNIQFPISLKRNWQAAQSFGGINENTLQAAVKLTPENLSEIVRTSERITKLPENSKIVSLLVAAKAHMKGSEFMESFILSWLMIERILRNKWESFLARKNVAGRRRKKLREWSIDSIIETMSLDNEIAEDFYDELMQLKTKRNDVNHEGYVNSQKDSIKCFQIAMQMVKENVNFGDPHD